MTRSSTDMNLSFQSKEFLYEDGGLGEFHQWVLPIMERWLNNRLKLRILDIGCGNGAVTKWCIDNRHDAVGIDMSASGIKIAQQLYPGVQFEKIEIGSMLPERYRKCFDLIVSLDVIEHLLLPRQLFQMSRDALKPGGEMILSTPYHGYLKNVFLAITNSFDRHWHPLRDYGHVKFFSRSSLIQLCEEQGFDIQAFCTAGRIKFLARNMIVYLRMRGDSR